MLLQVFAIKSIIPGPHDMPQDHGTDDETYNTVILLNYKRRSFPNN